MSTATVTGPTLRQILLDAIDLAFWQAQGEIAMCVNCGRAPAGVCAHPDHQAANEAARSFEDARKQIEGSLSVPEWADEMARLLPECGEEQS